MNTSASFPAKSGPNVNPKKMLSISAATLLLGGTAWAISKKIIDRTHPVPGETGPSASGSAEGSALPEDIDVAGKVTDSMSFGQAFETAREEAGIGGVFNWHGRWYNTFEQEEWNDLSLEQRIEYAEMITGEKLPVKPYHALAANTSQTASQPAPEPTVIEGHVNGQRVIGLDYNHDGVIDTLVMEGEDGQVYKVVDAVGDDGLDTVYRYDALDGELSGVVRLDHSFVLSNDDFSQGLEESMSKEVVDSILEPDAPTPAFLASNDDDDDDGFDDLDDEHIHPASSPESDDDTYVNDGDVQDMDD